MPERDEEFEALLESSSLGSPGARRLRERTRADRVDHVRDLAVKGLRAAFESFRARETPRLVADLIARGMGRPDAAALVDVVMEGAYRRWPRISDDPLPWVVPVIDEMFQAVDMALNGPAPSKPPAPLARLRPDGRVEKLINGTWQVDDQDDGLPPDEHSADDIFVQPLDAVKPVDLTDEDRGASRQGLDRPSPKSSSRTHRQNPPSFPDLD